VLEFKQVKAHYGAVMALDSISLQVNAGEIVTLIGANGAGKSTSLRCAVNLVRPSQGEIFFEGQSLSRIPTHRIAGLGIALVPEGRAVFANLSVRENLELGGYLQSRHQIKGDLEHVFALFPRLQERLQQIAGTLSGGEQQMLAMGRAMMARPRLLLLDEPSLGLAPIVVQSIFAAIAKINQVGTTVLLVEQNAHLALRSSVRGYVLESGRILMEGPSSELADDTRVREAYLGEG
jgi:branched-chain amino acid transport system ATP-binding protein